MANKFEVDSTVPYISNYISSVGGRWGYADGVGADVGKLVRYDLDDESTVPTTGVYAKYTSTGLFPNGAEWIPSGLKVTSDGRLFAAFLTCYRTVVVSLVSGTAVYSIPTATAAWVGALITGTGIPSNTIVISVVGTTVTLSAAATVTGDSTVTINSKKYDLFCTSDHGETWTFCTHLGGNDAPGVDIHHCYHTSLLDRGLCELKDSSGSTTGYMLGEYVTAMTNLSPLTATTATVTTVLGQATYTIANAIPAWVNQYIAGVNLNPGTYVLSVVGTTVTLSEAPIAAGSNILSVSLRCQLKYSVDGYTWTTINQLNTGKAAPSEIGSYITNGSGIDRAYQIHHCHGIVQDPYSQYVYIMFGDFDYAMVLRWDMVAPFVNNKFIPDYDIENDPVGKPGFKACPCNAEVDPYNGEDWGGQRFRHVDFLFTQNFICAYTDSSEGIWRASKDLRVWERMVNKTEVPTGHYGWTGVVTPQGSIIIIEGKASGTVHQLALWSSNDGEGATWQKVGYIGVNSAIGVHTPAVHITGDRIFIGIGNGAGKNGRDTVVFRDTGVPFSDEFPTILHPVYWVDPLGIWCDDSPDGYGRMPNFITWKSPYFALSKNVVPLGSRIIIAEGNYTQRGFSGNNSVSPYVLGLDCAFNPVSAKCSGMVVVEGAGAGVTINGTEGLTSGYLLQNAAVNGVDVVFKNIDFTADTPTTGTTAIIKAGSATSTGTVTRVRNCAVGEVAMATGADTIEVYDTLDVGFASVSLYNSTGKNKATIAEAGATITGSLYQPVITVSADYSPTGQDIFLTSESNPAKIKLGADNLIVNLSGLTNDEYIQVKAGSKRVAGFIGKGANTYVKGSGGGANDGIFGSNFS